MYPQHGEAPWSRDKLSKITQQDFQEKKSCHMVFERDSFAYDLTIIHTEPIIIIRNSDKIDPNSLRIPMWSTSQTKF